MTVSVPLRVRGLVIGAMEFELEGGEALAPEDIDLVLGGRRALRAGGRKHRLYEESRRVAQRETTLNEIGSRLQRTNSIDAVLAEAARGLQTSLGANRVAIRLGTPPKAEKAVKQHEHIQRRRPSANLRLRYIETLAMASITPRRRSRW